MIRSTAKAKNQYLNWYFSFNDAKTRFLRALIDLMNITSYFVDKVMYLWGYSVKETVLSLGSSIWVQFSKWFVG